MESDRTLEALKAVTDAEQAAAEGNLARAVADEKTADGALGRALARFQRARLALEHAQRSPSGSTLSATELRERAGYAKRLGDEVQHARKEVDAATSTRERLTAQVASCRVALNDALSCTAALARRLNAQRAAQARKAELGVEQEELDLHSAGKLPR